MKYLKTYTHYEIVPEKTKLFESNYNFLLDCQDIFLELKDNGFDVQFNTSIPFCFEVNINCPKQLLYYYTFEEISETMLRLNDFLKLNNRKSIVYEGDYRLSIGPLSHVIKNYRGEYKLTKLTIVIFIK
jgi:hypothetical protein